MEIGNSFWEYEDNCVLNNGIEIDILYRDMKDFMKGIEKGCLLNITQAILTQLACGTI